MSDNAVHPTTLRLLAPRALAGADRIATRLGTPPLVQSHARGALAFSDRMLQTWTGASERPVTSATFRGPSGAPLQAPWYDLALPATTARRAGTPPVVAPAFARPDVMPAVVRPGEAPRSVSVEQRAPLEVRASAELRAIDLVRDVVVRDAFVQELASGGPRRPAAADVPPAAQIARSPELAVVRAGGAAPTSGISLTQRLVAQLGRADEMLRLTRAAAEPTRIEAARGALDRSVAVRLAPPIVGGTAGTELVEGAQVARGQEALTARAFVAALGRAEGATGNAGVRSPAPVPATPLLAQSVATPPPPGASTLVGPAVAHLSAAATGPSTARPAARVEMSEDVASTPLGAALQAQRVAAAREAEAVAARETTSPRQVEAARGLETLDDQATPTQARSLDLPAGPDQPATDRPGATETGARVGSANERPRHVGPGVTFATAEFGASPFSLGAVGLGLPSASDRARVAALPGIGVSAELPASVPMVWPRLQRFIDRLAGPVLLQQTGAVALDALTSSAAGRANPMSLLDLGADASASRRAEGSSSGAATLAPRRAASLMSTTVAAALAGDESVRLRAAPTMTTLVPPAAEPASGVRSAEPGPRRPEVARPEAGIARTAGEERATVVEGPRADAGPGGPLATSRPDVFVADRDARMPAAASAGEVVPARSPESGSPPFDPFVARATATLPGELARYELAAGTASGAASGTGSGRYMPGRLAQRAELLATLAEQRADRQLGIEPPVAVRSVNWSSDAFTVVSLDPWASSPVGGTVRPAGATYSSSAGAAARGLGATLGIGSSIAAGAVAARDPEPARDLRRPFEAAFITPERWTTARGVEHVAPRRDAGLVAASYADLASRAAVLGGGVAPGSIAALLAFADAQLGPRLLEAARPLPVAAPSVVYLAGDDATPRRLAGDDATPRRLAGDDATPRRLAGDDATPRRPRALVGVGGDVQGSPAGVAPSSLSSARALTIAGMPGFIGGDAVRVGFAGTQGGELPPTGASLQRDFSRRYVDLSESSAPRPTALDVSGHFSLGARPGRFNATAESGAAMTLGHGAIGQLGRRSEQVAGEVGVRVGGLASEFLIDVHSDGVPGDQGATLHARDAARPWLSTSEWILLSLFPSTAVAHEIASGPAIGRFPLAAVGELAAARGASAAAAGVGGRASSVGGGVRLGVVGGELGGRARIDAGETTSLADRAPGLPALSVSSAPYEHIDQGRSSPTTAYLPDGRTPRGNRMVARAAMPTVGGAPPSLAYTSEAAERRAASPVGAPLWGHLRPQARPVVDGGAVLGGHAFASQSASRANGGLSPLQATPHGPRAAALELVAPFIEASRAETTGGAASFNRPASPVVSARAPDQPTKSLVTALSAASSQPSNDRLTMADLTLISIVSATEQVAASTQGSAPDIAPADGREKPGSSHAAGSGFSTNEDHEVEIVAQRAFDRFMDELRRYTEHKGDTWEK